MLADLSRTKRRSLARSLHITSLPGWMLLLVVVLCARGDAQTPVANTQPIDYVVLATNKTSTMENELNEAANAGYRFMGVMGGETAFGGSEVVAIMSKTVEATPPLPIQAAGDRQDVHDAERDARGR